ncbi:MAG: class I SAM-dependent methyltransferase [Pyrinomonadaceae bacterium]
MNDSDLSNGYDDHAETFIRIRSPEVGVSRVRLWARSLPTQARVLEIGCGSGIPITRVLISEGMDVSAVDASPKMVSAFQRNFPDIPVICEAAERLIGFDRPFDAAIAWGLMFLLTPEAQRAVIRNMGDSLNKGGRFLFTSPKEVLTWNDSVTDLESVSLGAAEYKNLLSLAGFDLTAEYEDEGQNHYYDAKKR